MSTGTIVFIITMGFALLIHAGLTYIIVKKKDYHLISGFSNRPKEEQEELINNGYPQAFGNLLKTTFILLSLSFILYFLPVPYGFEIGMGIFAVVLFGGIIYIQKYEVAKKRRRGYWLTGGFFAVLIIGLGSFFIYSLKEETVSINNSHLKISGMYGVEWSLKEIDHVELLDELPKVDLKTNGFASFGKLKGSFQLEPPYGEGKLYVYKNYPPFLYIKGENKYIILNRKDVAETERLYRTLIKKVKINE